MKYLGEYSIMEMGLPVDHYVEYSTDIAHSFIKNSWWSEVQTYTYVLILLVIH